MRLPADMSEWTSAVALGNNPGGVYLVSASLLRAIFFRSSKKRSFFPPGELVRWPWWYNMLRPNEVFQPLIMGPLCWEMPLSASKSASDKMISTIRKWWKRCIFQVSFPWLHLDNKELLSRQKNKTGIWVFCLVAKSVLVCFWEIIWWKCQSLAFKRQSAVESTSNANTWHVNHIASMIVSSPVS